MVSHEWVSNRGRHSPIPLGSPTEAPTYPDYMKLAQNRGPQPQSTLRVFLTDQNLIPSDATKSPFGMSLPRSFTIGHGGPPNRMASQSKLSRNASAATTSRTHHELHVPMSSTTGGRISAKPKANKSSIGDDGQALAGVAELPLEQSLESSHKMSGPKAKITKKETPQKPDTQRSTRSDRISEAPTAGSHGVKEATDIAGSVGSIGGSTVRSLEPKTKALQGPEALTHLKSARGPVTSPPEKAIMAPHERDHSRSVEGVHIPKSLKSAKVSHTKSFRPNTCKYGNSSDLVNLNSKQVEGEPHSIKALHAQTSHRETYTTKAQHAQTSNREKEHHAHSPHAAKPKHAQTSHEEKQHHAHSSHTAKPRHSQTSHGEKVHHADSSHAAKSKHTHKSPLPSKTPDASHKKAIHKGGETGHQDASAKRELPKSETAAGAALGAVYVFTITTSHSGHSQKPG